MNDGQKQILTKRFQTTMIGALFEFEKTFGYLWGNHKTEDEELTDKEEQFLDLWEETRNRVLNNGNNQLRKSLAEISRATGETKYSYNFSKKRNEKYED